MHSISSNGRKNTLPALTSKNKFPGMGDKVRSTNKPSSTAGNKDHNSPKKKVEPLKPVSGMRVNMKDRSDSGRGKEKSTSNMKTTLERSESFSKYSPLPAINGTNCDRAGSGGNKRSFETWSSENPETSSSSTCDEKDILSDTIKRMKLGNVELGVTESKGNPQRSSNSFPHDDIVRKCTVQANGINSAATSAATTTTDNTSTAIEVIIRLPDGERSPQTFFSGDTLANVILVLTKVIKKKVDLKKYVLYNNHVPKRELKNCKSTLLELGVKDKSVLTLDTRDS